jgi:hypothetical protein
LSLANAYGDSKIYLGFKEAGKNALSLSRKNDRAIRRRSPHLRKCSATLSAGWYTYVCFVPTLGTSGVISICEQEPRSIIGISSKW